MTVHGIDLLNEKNLWSIYKQCLFRLPPSKFNVVMTSLFFGSLVCDAFLFEHKVDARISIIRSLADSGLGFGTTILGFLIAGFTIFATLSKPELFRRMYDTSHVRSGLSFFKVNFFAFVEVFVVYLVLLCFCIAIKVFASSGGFVPSVVNFFEIHPYFGYCINRVLLINSLYVVFCTFSFYSLLALKSFVFNTYHTVVTAVVWSFNPRSSNDLV